ncbi:ATP-binding cassette domain-containing protein, partial [Streptomyces sp. TRM76130]|nr:ATP-binding cassette domain-containing protein [Streptomyces sp. TRM76130]
MIQAFGLTSTPRKELPPAVDDVSFEARAGRVTALLGVPGAGKTTVLRLMLELQRGRGVTHFRGRPLHRIAHPSREVGVLLGEVPGHPARTVRGHLRMLCAAAGVPVRRADEVLEATGLVSLCDERLGTLSRGMDRRLGLACALLADPHTLVLDGPAEGLSARESRWLYDALRGYADQGGTVLYTTADPKEAARTADHVVTLERGQVVADQRVADFSRTRLRPRVAVRTPYAARLATLLAKEARAAHRSVEVVREEGNRLSVYGSTCADVGETAFRHGILVHQLADEVHDMGPGTDADAEEQSGADVRTGTAGSAPGPGRPPVTGAVIADAEQATERSARVDPAVTAGSTTEAGSPDTTPVAPADARQAATRSAPASTAGAAKFATGSDRPAPESHPPAPTSALRAPARVPSPPLPLTPGGDPLDTASSALPPPISVRCAPSPLRPLRYEVRRVTGVGTGMVTGAVVLVLSAVTAVLLARVGHTPQSRLLAAWPREAPLPPAALGAGL